MAQPRAVPVAPITVSNVEDERTKLAAGEVVRLMSETGDPKIQQSEFLQFMSKMNTGELKIKVGSGLLLF